MLFPLPIYVTEPLIPPLDQFMDELKDVFECRIFTNGATKHQALENMLKQYLKTPHLSLFNNGTIGLMTAIKALKLSGEVITTPFTFPATPHALAWNGITPVFCDIDPKTMNIDPKKVIQNITEKTSAILAVHVYGIPCQVKALEEIAKAHNLKVIYDAAHAFGAEIGGQGIGSFGDVSMFSFHATKLFHTAEGGALTCQDKEVKAEIDLLRNFGIRNEEEISGIGLNGKLNEIQAALGLVNLKVMDKEWQERQGIAAVYRNKLEHIPGIHLPELASDVRPSMQYMVIRIDKKQFGLSRDEVHRALKEHNIITRKYFYPLCSDYSQYRNLPSSAHHLLPEAQKAAHEVLCLPFYGRLGQENAAKIADNLISLGS